MSVRIIIDSTSSIREELRDKVTIVPLTVRFGEETGREAFARVIQREFELQQRNVPAKEKRTAVTEALLETTLKKATVLIKVKR